MIKTEETIKIEDHLITQAEDGMLSQDQGIGGEYDWIYKWQVPINQQILLLPKHRFGVYLKRLNAPVDYALAYDAPAYTDETTTANEATVNDMTLLPAVEATNDAYYFGFRFPFSCLRLKYSTAGVSAAKDLAWEYYNGTSWVAVPNLSDATIAFTAAAGTHNVTFTPPGDWARTAINGKTAYWLRARCVTADYTTQPLGDQAWIGGALEVDNPDMVAIEIRSPNGWKRETLIEAMYEQVKEMTDVNKRSQLNIEREFWVKSGEWLVILVKCRGGLVDVSECFFALESGRVRKSIYA